MLGSSRVAAQFAASQEVLSSVELVFSFCRKILRNYLRKHLQRLFKLTIWWLMKSELEIIRKATVVACFKVSHSPGRTEENNKSAKDNKRHGRDLNWAPPEYNSKALSPEPTCSWRKNMWATTWLHTTVTLIWSSCYVWRLLYSPVRNRMDDV
jgi:hypothetical protein